MSGITQHSKTLEKGLSDIFGKPAKHEPAKKDNPEYIGLTIPDALTRENILDLAELIRKMPPEVKVELKRSGAGQSVAFSL
jgi:hypothetical protein